MLFGKKQEDKREVPIEEVQKMSKKGLSDKDIIKQLKSKGFSYESIESAMLKAVRDGVDDEPKVMQRMETESPAADNIFAAQQEEEFSPEFMQAAPDFNVDIPADEEPQALLEELVEGIVEEKWHKFDDQTRKTEEGFDRIRAELKQFEMKIDQAKRDSPTRDIEARITTLSEQLEDVEARVGGLEKAFKQFLPSLTRNIESLSNMIHEMKEKQGTQERKEFS